MYRYSAQNYRIQVGETHTIGKNAGRKHRLVVISGRMRLYSINEERYIGRCKRINTMGLWGFQVYEPDQLLNVEEFTSFRGRYNCL